MTLPLLLVKYDPFRWQLSQLQLYPDHTSAETPQNASEVSKVLDAIQIIYVQPYELYSSCVYVLTVQTHTCGDLVPRQII